MIKPFINKAIVLILFSLTPGVSLCADNPHSVTIIEPQEKALVRSYTLIALHEDAQGRFVYQAHDEKDIRSWVKTGIIRAAHIQITEGIQPEDHIIIAGFIGPRDGKTITTDKKNDHD